MHSGSRRGGRTRACAVLLVLVLAGCLPGGTARVTLAELVDDPDRYDGREVVTEGVVQVWEDPFHHWIEDVEDHRVEVEPDELVEDLVGARVRVRGEFRFDPEQGRAITIDHLEVVDDTPVAAR